MDTVALTKHPKHRGTAIVQRQIPSRDPHVRREVARLFQEASWLSASDMHATIRWVTLCRRFGAMAEHLQDLDVVTAQGQPRKMDSELRATSAELSRLENALGLTAAARAALGVDVLRLKGLAGATDPLSALMEREP